MKKIIVMLILLLMLGLAACSGKTESGGSPRVIETNEPSVKEFSVTVSHTNYEPVSIEVQKGDAVRIKAVTSKGTSTHNHGITIDEYNINEAVVTDDKNSPKIIEFVADKAGTFGIYCKTCWDGPFGRNHPPIQATLVVR